LAVALVAVVVTALVAVALAERAVVRADAQAAADFAALAGVLEGEDGAADLARRNGAELVSFQETAACVHVVVRIGTVRAEAFADLTFSPGQG
jgi:hypothetical protein